jgi:hypothetical protein
MSTACTASSLSSSGVRAPAARGRSNARVARAATVTQAKATTSNNDAVSEKKEQQQQNQFFTALRRSAAAAAAAAVIVASAPDAACASNFSHSFALTAAKEVGVPPAPSNGPLKNLPRGACVFCL